MGGATQHEETAGATQSNTNAGALSWHAVHGATGLLVEDPELFERAAGCELPVLVSGELGSGKQLAARALHAAGRRAQHPLCLLGCECSSEAALGLELDRALSGTEGETLILVAAGKLSKALQLRLTCVLDEDAAVPDPRVRCIALTTKPAKQLLADGTLEAELYYHLATIEIRLRPLRERRGELPGLVAAILDRIARRTGSARARVTAAAMDKLLAHSWPDNLRELDHTLERAHLLANGGTIRPRHFVLEPARLEQMPVLDTLAETERGLIARTLEAMDGNRRRTAASLGIGLRTLYDKIKRYENGTTA